MSGVDFKEKSIQVIRKTPEAYVKAGWHVDYIVGRDNSLNGDYFYESIINPKGVFVHRFNWPFTKVDGLLTNTYWKAFWFRVRNLSLVINLALKARQLIRKRDFHIIYGYEIPGVLAIRLLRMMLVKTNAKFVTRFQGVLYVKEWLRKKQKFRVFSNWDAFIALKTRADLCIMTNDGSQGLNVLKQIGSPVKNVLFCPNGVDEVKLDQDILTKIRTEFYADPQKKYLLSISRLDNHKRIDRGLKIMNQMVHSFGFTNFRFIVIGGGSEHKNLTTLVSILKLNNYVEFLGPIKHAFIPYHFALSDLFLSMYTSTNVGNPLLEAIRYNKLIVTLNNGDTGEWIKHKVSGLIYDVDDDRDLSSEDYKTIAHDVIRILNDHAMKEEITNGVAAVGKNKLWTWDQRMNTEVTRVELLLG